LAHTVLTRPLVVEISGSHPNIDV